MGSLFETNNRGTSSLNTTPAILAVEPANRPAAITIVDISEGELVQAVSRLHRESFSGYLNARLGGGYVAALISWFAREKDAIAIAAIDSDHHVVGYAIGAPSHLTRPMRRDMFWVTARSIILRAWLFFDRRLWKVGIIRLKNAVKIKNVGSVPDDVRVSEPLGPTMFLFGIGVAVSQRKNGVGLRLLQAFEDRARALKMRSLLLWVYEDKLAPRRLYEKCGWCLCPDVSGPTGVSKYVRLIDSQGTGT